MAFREARLPFPPFAGLVVAFENDLFPRVESVYWDLATESFCCRLERDMAGFATPEDALACYGEEPHGWTSREAPPALTVSGKPAAWSPRPAAGDGERLAPPAGPRQSSRPGPSFGSRSPVPPRRPGRRRRLRVHPPAHVAQRPTSAPARRLLGRVLQPGDFSGGGAPGQADYVRR